MRLEFVTSVHAPVEDVFSFFIRPANMAGLLRDWPSFRLLRASDVVTVGGQLWVEETAFAVLPIVMGFEFTALSPCAHFAETMIHGPFYRFEHRHTFDRDGTRTVIRDTIDGVLHWQFGGSIATPLLTLRHLQRLFAYRAQRLREIDKSGFNMHYGDDCCGNI